MINYKQKYFKYKQKYLMNGGGYVVIKIDKDDNEIERYDSIKEAAEKNGIGRGVIDRMVASKEFRNNVGYKFLNKENKTTILTKKQKEELFKDFQGGMTIEELCKKYNKIRKYMKNLVRKFNPDIQ